MLFTRRGDSGGDLSCDISADETVVSPSRFWFLPHFTWLVLGDFWMAAVYELEGGCV
jgi:hypothetical protein